MAPLWNQLPMLTSLFRFRDFDHFGEQGGVRGRDFWNAADMITAALRDLGKTMNSLTGLQAAPFSFPSSHSMPFSFLEAWRLVTDRILASPMTYGTLALQAGRGRCYAA